MLCKLFNANPAARVELIGNGRAVIYVQEIRFADIARWYTPRGLQPGFRFGQRSTWWRGSTWKRTRKFWWPRLLWRTTVFRRTKLFRRPRQLRRTRLLRWARQLRRTKLLRWAR